MLAQETVETPESNVVVEKKERTKRVKKLKPAKGPAKTKATAFLTETSSSIPGDKVIVYTISRPSEEGGMVDEEMEFDVNGKNIAGDEKEILNTFGIVFEKGRSSAVFVKQTTKRIHKETGAPCVNVYGYRVQDGEWQKLDATETDRLLYTNPQTGFKIPRDPGVSIM